MKQMKSAFYNDSIQVSWAEIVKLILGGEIKQSSTIIGLWRMPDNGCRCENCKRRLGIRDGCN